MRTKLANHVGELVHGAGWFKDVEKIKDTDSVRVLISQPTLKKPNRNLLWKDQETISTEHHLNMFTSLKEWDEMKKRLTRYHRCNFVGKIYEYTRLDGSKDFGVKTIPTPDVEGGVYSLTKEITIFFDHNKIWDDNALQKLEQDFLPQIIHAEEIVKSLGDRLPTHKRTYKEYCNYLHEGKKELGERVTTLSHRLNQRDHRRLVERQTRKAKGKRAKPLWMQLAT